MLQVFRTLMLTLMLYAPPGTIGCNNAFTRCWIEFQNPIYLETFTVKDTQRIKAVIEIVKIEKAAKRNY